MSETSTETRAALIDAAAKAQTEWDIIHCGGRISWDNLTAEEQDLYRDDASSVVAAVLPLVADAIEAQRDAHFQEYGNEEPRACGEDWGYTRAAGLVRALSKGDNE